MYVPWGGSARPLAPTARSVWLRVDITCDAPFTHVSYPPLTTSETHTLPSAAASSAVGFRRSRARRSRQQLGVALLGSFRPIARGREAPHHVDRLPGRRHLHWRSGRAEHRRHRDRCVPLPEGTRGWRPARRFLATIPSRDAASADRRAPVVRRCDVLLAVRAVQAAHLGSQAQRSIPQKSAVIDARVRAAARSAAVLDDNMAEYRCCQGYFDCACFRAGTLGDQGNPCCLLVEVCLCPGLAVQVAHLTSPHLHVTSPHLHVTSPHVTPFGVSSVGLT